MPRSRFPGDRTQQTSTALVLALCCLDISGQQVLAADGPAASLEEVLVTARRREERMQSTPVAVAVFSGDELEIRSAQTLADLGSVAPNLYVSSGPSASPSAASFFIRGVGQTDFIPTTDPGVGVYVDGVYIARQTGNMLSLIEPERIEVLRGPQGTLFGRNTIGGAISITSKRPGEDFSGKLELTAGNFDRIDGKLHLEGPLVADTLSGMLTLATRNQDGYGDRILTGEDMGDTDMRSGRLALNWTPGENLEVLLAVDGTTRDEAAMPHNATDLVLSDPNFQPLYIYNTLILTPPPPMGFGSPYLTPSATCPGFPFPATQCTSPFISSGESYDSMGTGANRAELDTWGISLVADWRLGDTSVKSITAFRDQEDSIGVDYDASPLTVSEQDEIFDTQFFSQELQLFGNVGERTEWLLGAFYSREKTDIEFNADFLQPFFGPSIRTEGDLTTDSYALFASVSRTLGEKLSITGGLRYSKDEKDFSSNSNFAHNPFLMGAPSSLFASGAPGPIPDFLPPGTILSDSDSWDDLSPKVSLEYQATPTAFFYGSVSRGYKSGSYNGRVLTGSSALTPYDPEEVINYEIGAKLDLADNRLRLNMSVFHTDYDDIQTTILISDGAVVNTPTVNAGEARIRGFELELSAAPARGLRLDGSVGYVDASYRELGAPVNFPAATIPFGTDATFAQTPEWTMSAGVQYEFDLDTRGTLTFRGDINYRDEVYPNVPNEDAVLIDSLTLVNARISYMTENEKWQLAVFGTNLTDEYYPTFGFVAFGIASGYLGRPREYGVVITRRF